MRWLYHNEIASHTFAHKNLNQADRVGSGRAGAFGGRSVAATAQLYAGIAACALWRKKMNRCRKF